MKFIKEVMKVNTKRSMKGIAEVVGVIMILMITLSLSSLTYMYVGNVYAQYTRPIEVVDAYCMDGKATFVIRNGGDVDLNANSLSCRPISQTCTSSCTVPSNIAPGAAGAVTATGCTLGRAHTWKLIGPSNGIDLYASCL